MTLEAAVTTLLDEADLARVDALAEQKGVTHDEMLVVLVRSGLVECENEDAPPTTQRRPK